MRSWKRYAAALLFNIGFTLLVLWSKGFDVKLHYVDAFTAVGVVSILLGLLILVAEAGAFDTMAYGFSTLASNRKYKDLFEYTTRKKEIRRKRGKPYLPLIAVGLVFFVIGLLISAV